MFSAIMTHLQSVGMAAIVALTATSTMTLLLLANVLELDPFDLGPFGVVLLIGGVGGIIWRQPRAILFVPLMSLASVVVGAVFVHSPAQNAPESSEPFTPVMVLLLSGMLYMLMAWGVIAGYALGRLLWPPPAESWSPRPNTNTLRQHADKR